MISGKSKGIKKAKVEQGAATSSKALSEESKEVFHIHLVKVNDKDIPKNLYSITEKNLFEALLYPLKPQDFFEKDYS
jgi:hypothetical protein